MTDKQPQAGAATAWPAGDGEMGRRIRAHDWAATSLGPVEHWPERLKAAVELMLAARQPVSINWGPDGGGVTLYNEGYIPILGAKHPHALGRPYRAVWPEIWDEYRPVIAATMAGEAHSFVDRAVPLAGRDGRPMSWFTFSWTPLRDEAGGVAGFFCAATETTDEVLARRRLREAEARQAFLLALGDAMRAQSGTDSLIEVAARQIGERLAASRIMFAEFDEAKGVADVFHGWFADGAKPFPTVMRLEDYEGPILDDLRAGRAVRIEDTRAPALARSDLAAIAELGVASLLSVPLVVAGRLVVNLSVHQHTARHWTDDDVALVQEVAERLWADLVRARAEAALREGEERQAFLLQLSDALRPVGHPAEAQRVAMRLLGEFMGADRAFYFRAEPTPEGWVHIVDDNNYSRLGMPPRVGRRSRSEFGSTVFSGLQRGEPVVVADVRALPGLTEEQRANYEAARIQAFIGVPVVKDGRYVAGACLHSAAPRLWTGREVALLRDVAERTWAAVERTRAEAALRESEEKYRTVFESMDEGFLVHEMIRNKSGQVVDYRLLEANPAHQRATGLPRETIGKLGSEFMPEVEPYWLELFHRVSTSGVTERVEMRNAPTSRWYNVQVSPVRGHDRIAIVFDDVTTRKRAEAALRESEERFQQFARASAAGLWIRNAGTLAMEFVSSAIATIYGVDADALLGDVTRWAAMIVPDDRDVALGHLEAARRGEVTVHEFRIQRPSDGAFRWIRNTDFPLRDNSHIPCIGGIVEDVTEAKLAAEHSAVLLAELQHRVRNIMALLRSITNRTADRAESVPEYRDLMMGRLLAFARVQALLTRAANVSIGMASIVHDEVSVQAQHEGQYVLDGPDVALSPKAAEVLTLAIHELATNAVKHGAFSAPDGKVTVRWSTFEKRGRPWLAFDWTEEGAPVRPAPLSDAPRRRGFGSELIEGRIPYELRGRGQVTIEPGGARCHLEFPLQDGASILETGAPQRATVFGGAIDMTGEADLTGRCILVVEDDYYLATDTARALRGAGAEVLGPCATEEDAQAELDERRPDAVVVDINLGPGPSFKLAETLKDAGIPFVFTTGYDAEVIPAEFQAIERLQKPLQLRQIVGAVAKLTTAA